MRQGQTPGGQSPTLPAGRPAGLRSEAQPALARRLLGDNRGAIGRRTNLALLVALAAAFATGWLAFAYATAPARGVRRRRAGRWASLALGVLVLASLAGGLLHSTGLLRWWAGYTAMELHVGAALVAVPLAVWHVLARPVRPRPVDLARRALLRQGATIAVGAVGYGASEAAARLAQLPGGERRFTGSYEAGSFQPELMPVSSWMFDPVPKLDEGGWRLRVASAAGVREWTYEELQGFRDELRAVLDCTGGFWSEQHWSGVLLQRLLPAGGAGQSVRVVSATGYDRRFPLADLPEAAAGRDGLRFEAGFCSALRPRRGQPAGHGRLLLRRGDGVELACRRRRCESGRPFLRPGTRPG